MANLDQAGTNEYKKKLDLMASQRVPENADQ